MIQMLECLKLSWRFLSLSYYFWILISSFWGRKLKWVLVSFLSLLVHFTFSFLSLFIAFIFSSILQPYSTNSASILITSVLNSESDRLAISSLSLHHLVVFFLELWSILSFGPFFFFLGAPVSSKRRSLRCSLGWGNPHHCTRGGVEGEQCCLFCSLLTFSHFPRYPQASWALLVLIPVWVDLRTF